MKLTFKSLLFGSTPAHSTVFNVVYLLFRFYCGISMAIGAGLAKVFHKIDENGGEGWDNLAFGIPDWFVKQVGEIGFTFISPSLWASLAVYGEFIGGLLIALGLLTRFSALQMAFQFFVVAFIWYDEPMPFVMYYQQLIFWAFVLIATVGGGRFSLDHWLMNVRSKVQLSKKKVVAALLLCLAVQGFGQSGHNSERVSFTISNPSLKTREVELCSFDYSSFTSCGYGYDLGALSSHAVNMPIGTRVYDVRKAAKKLLFVVSAADQGRKFDLSKTYEISEAQKLQVAVDEQNQATAQRKKAVESPSLAALAQAKGYEMISFQVAGKTSLGRQIKIRAQMPFDTEKSNIGFSQRLSKSTTLELSYPVGTKIYLCDGDYWLGEVNETLLFTVSSETANDLIRI